MNPTEQELLREVAGLIEDAERAIVSHPPRTMDVYRKGRDAFLAGQETATEEPWMRTAGRRLEDLALLRRYMLSSSFISAWYHLHGDRRRRDKAANSCVLLVACFGEDPEDVMRRYIGYEQLWRSTLKAEGVAPSRWLTPSAAALAYPLMIGFWVFQRMPFLEAAGYSVTQLGYLVAGSGLIFGSFRVLGISTRLGGLGLGAVLWVVGVLLVNL